LAVVLVLAGCGGGQGRDPGGGNGGLPTVGSQAPTFTLTGLDGKSHSLAEYRGQVVLINFWATWCIPCRAEMPELETAYKKHRANGVVVLGIDWKESRETVQAFIEERQVTYPILLDSDGRAYNAFQVPALPQTYVLDRQGKIVVMRTGLATREKFDAELRSAGA
jgi:peroxiredoxin